MEITEPEIWTAMETTSREIGEHRSGSIPDFTSPETLKVRIVEPLGAENAMKAWVPDMARPDGFIPQPTQPEGDGAVPTKNTSRVPCEDLLMRLRFHAILADWVARFLQLLNALFWPSKVMSDVGHLSILCAKVSNVEAPLLIMMSSKAEIIKPCKHCG